MSVVFVVTSGSYSDYRIDAVFSTRELAEAYCVRHNSGRYSDDEADIEEWTLDELKDAERGPVHICILTSDGSLNKAWTIESYGMRDPRFRRGEFIQPDPRVAYQFRGESAESPEVALKMAAEARQAYLRERGIA